MYYFTHFSAVPAASAPRCFPRTEPPGRPGGCFVRHFSAFFENEGNPAQKKKFIGIGTGLVVSVHRARAGCDHDLLFVVASRRGGAAAVAIAFSLATVAIVAVVVVICMGFWFFKF